MTEFKPEQVYPNQCVCPTDDGFKDWVRQEVNAFGGGSTYLDFDIFNVAQDILAETAIESNIVAFNAVISWRAKKQAEIVALVNNLVERNIIPGSAARSPIQLLPISKPAYQNRVTLIRLVPELLDKFEIPDTEDKLQTKFNAPLYWFAIVLARARKEAPFMCELRKVIDALVDLGIAKVPSEEVKDVWISKITADTELQKETLYLGVDEITKGLTKRKPYFGWRLPPYDVCEVTEKPEAEAVVVITEVPDGREEPWDSTTAGFAYIEDGKGEGEREEGGGGERGGERGGRVRTETRGVLRDIGLVITMFILFVMLSGADVRLAFLGEIERMLGRIGY